MTPVELIDKAVAVAERPEAIFRSFGDMLRVPGSSKSCRGGVSPSGAGSV